MEPEDYNKYLELSKQTLVSEFEKRLDKSNAEFLISWELAQIRKFEESVSSFKQYYSSSFLNNYQSHFELPGGVNLPMKDHQFEFEYLRIKSGYYSINVNRKPNSKTAFVIANYIYFKEYLLEKQREKEDNGLEKPGNNPRPDLFVSISAFSLFFNWHSKYFNDKKKHLVNYSFIIRRMQEDKLATIVKQDVFLEYLRTIEVVIDKLKPLNKAVTKEREELYIEMKKDFKDL